MIAPPLSTAAKNAEAGEHSPQPSERKSSSRRPPELTSDPALEKKLIEDAGGGFQLRRTSHFAVAYDVPRGTLKNLILRIEGTYYKVHRFCRTKKIPLDVSTTKLEIMFCDRWTTYERQAHRAGLNPAGTYGFYNPRANRSVFYNVDYAPEVVRLREQVADSRKNLARLEDVLDSLSPRTDRVRLRYPDRRSVTVTVPEAYQEVDHARRRLHDLEVKLNRHVEYLIQSVIQHEVAHHVLFAGGVHVRGAANPMWLVEGLAAQFETPPARPRRTPTSINQERLGDFRRAYEQERLLPLKRVISDHKLFTENSQNRPICYAEAWALVYYLSRKRPDRFAAYVRALASRRPGELIAEEHERAEYRRFFGPLDKKFVLRWEKHIMKLAYRERQFGR